MLEKDVEKLEKIGYELIFQAKSLPVGSHKQGTKLKHLLKIHFESFIPFHSDIVMKN